MLSVKTLNALQSWACVWRWTLVGTLWCVVISVGFNAVMFDDLGGVALQRSLLSATILPAILGVPLFLFLSLRVRGLALSNLRLGVVARTDSLTACLNRGAFTSKVSTLLAQRTADASGALLMIDADNFKSINDMYGHVSGDEALAIIARSIRSVLRSSDLVGRMGGEEFAVFLPDVDFRDTEVICERIRRSVFLANFVPEGSPHTLSVSIGGAVFTGQACFDHLFRVADERLYDAKKTGRNRATVVHAAPAPEVLQEFA